jgi:hypothetical protein
MPTFFDCERQDSKERNISTHAGSDNPDNHTLGNGLDKSGKAIIRATFQPKYLQPSVAGTCLSLLFVSTWEDPDSDKPVSLFVMLRGLALPLVA